MAKAMLTIMRPKDGFSGADYWPEGNAARKLFYKPVERGFEREILKRLEWWEKKRRERAGGMNPAW